jgi:hypothetical protein
MSFFLWWMYGLSLTSRYLCSVAGGAAGPLQLMHLESPPRVRSLPLAQAGCYPAASRHLPTPTQAVWLAPTISWIASSSSWALLPLSTRVLLLLCSPYLALLPIWTRILSTHPLSLALTLIQSSASSDPTPILFSSRTSSEPKQND